MTSEFPLSWPPGFPHRVPGSVALDTPEERVRRNLELPLDLGRHERRREHKTPSCTATARPHSNQSITNSGVASISHGKAASRPSLATNGTLSATTSKP
jgi:hypothetical protein